MILKINKPIDKATVKAYIDRLPDKQFDISILKRKEIRSMPQNKLYWLWINCISSETGNDQKDLHEYFSDQFLPRETFQVFGITSERPVSTTKLTTGQFSEYLDKVEVFASSELGIVLPQPQDLHFAEFYERYSNQ